MSQVDPAPGPSSSLGQKNLSTLHAVAQSLAIGPMFSTALILGLVSNPVTGAGWNATLAVLLAGLGVLAIGYAVALYARRFAGAGAVYEYLTHGAHPWAGVLTAGVFFLGTLFLGGGGIYLGVGNLAEGFWNAHIDSGSSPAWWVWGLIALVIVLVLNYIGVRVAVGAMLTFAVVSFIPMLILAIVIIAKGGADGVSLSVFDPSEVGLLDLTGGGVLGGVLLGILLFVGFEAAASIGEESHDPHRSIPRAVLFTIAAAAAFYVVMSFAFSMGYGKEAVEQGAWAGDPAAVNTMATRYIGSWYATILDLVVILDAMALALAICVTVGRGFFALGRDGLLPRFFTRTSRHGTPWVGNLVDRRRGAGPDGDLVARGLRRAALLGAGRVGQPRAGAPRRVRDVHLVGHRRVSRGGARLLRPRGGSVRARATGGRQAVAVRDRGGSRGDTGAGVPRRAEAGAAQREQRELASALLDDRHRRRGGHLVRRSHADPPT